eukprot:5098573-Pleurochrysis_carterae.AAC.1
MEALNSSDMGSHEVEKLVGFKTIFFGKALRDQVLVKWKYWYRDENITWEPRQKIDDMGDDWKHRVCVLEAKYRAREEAQAERALAAHREKWDCDGDENVDDGVDENDDGGLDENGNGMDDDYDGADDDDDSMDHSDDGVGADVPLSPEASPADDPAVAGAELDGVSFSPPRDFKTPAPRREHKKTFIAAKAPGPSNLPAAKMPRHETDAERRARFGADRNKTNLGSPPAQQEA